MIEQCTSGDSAVQDVTAALGLSEGCGLGLIKLISVHAVVLGDKMAPNCGSWFQMCCDRT